MSMIHGVLFNHGAFQFTLEEELRTLQKQSLNMKNQETWKRLEIKAQIRVLEKMLKAYKKNLKDQLGV